MLSKWSPLKTKEKQFKKVEAIEYKYIYR